MSITIVHIITTIDLGGAEKQVLALATKQKEMGNDVTIIFLKDNPKLLKNFLLAGVKIEVKFSEINFFRQILLLRRGQISGKTIYHAHLPRAELLCAFALRPKSFVVTRHNSEPFFPDAPSLISRILSRFVLKRAFASISISNAVTHFLQFSKEMNGYSINEVIYYGLGDTIVRHKNKFIPESKVHEIGIVARLVPQKNLPLLIDSVAILNKTMPAKFHLKILGEGPLKEELETLIIHLGVEELVDFQAKTKDVKTFYKSLNLFVLTSKYEGFGLVLLEAMSAGVPVVARDTSSIPEVLGENHPGLFKSDDPTELASKIWSILSDRKTFDQCLKYQSEQLKNFTIDKSEAAHKKLYTRLLKQMEASAK
jgi:glycosyltransferase involved in cell wall biosynthesis